MKRKKASGMLLAHLDCKLQWRNAVLDTSRACQSHFLLTDIKGRPMRSCQTAALSSRLQLAAQAPSLGNLNSYF
jgi:hypothetical protein